MFSSFEFNHAYEDTDVLVSLTKLKNHIEAGMTLSMKNLFGLPPNTIYGREAGKETATGHRAPMHDPKGYETLTLPGLKEDAMPLDSDVAGAPGHCGCVRRPAHSPGHH